MPFRALADPASTGADGRSANAGSVKTIRILDMEDKTAGAKMTAVRGFDDIHLARTAWWEMSVLWQSLPENDLAASRPKFLLIPELLVEKSIKTPSDYP